MRLIKGMKIVWPSVGLAFCMTCLPPGNIAAEVSQNIAEPVSGRAMSIEGIIPADVLARVELIQNMIEVIRFDMGKPKASTSKPIATNAQPHEVYFQAMTLFLKADRLALELTGSTGITPEMVKASSIQPFHVWKMVNAAYDRIVTVVQELRIREKISEQKKSSSTTPTEVGRAIVQTNRQLNVLLERRFAPSDVYQQVTMAIRYTQALLAQFPEAQEDTNPHIYERGKQPSEVFLRLIQCYGLLEKIAGHSHLKVLHLNQDMAEQVVKNLEVRPSDVYDIATLLVSDLAYLHAHIPQAKFPGSVSYPGRKFPSHVFQQAGILLSQLTALEKNVKIDPQWLNR